MTRPDTRPDWLLYWRRLWRERLVGAPLPSPEWIERWVNHRPPSSPQPRAVEDVPFHGDEIPREAA